MEKQDSRLFLVAIIAFVLGFSVFYGAGKIKGFIFPGERSGYDEADSYQTGNDSKSDESSEEIGFDTGMTLKQFPKKLVDVGVIDIEKYAEVSGQINDQQLDVLSSTEENQKIYINSANSNFYLNLFWGLGLAQKNEFLESSELGEYKKTGELSNLASVGGWTISSGVADSHFSKHNIVNLTMEQKRMVADIASKIYRPCCNNHSRFADCNHGMAMLGLLYLGIDNGLSENDLYSLALNFNSAWFEDNYIKIAEYFKAFENKDISEVNPKIILSAKFSSGSGFSNNVAKPLASLNLQNGNGSQKSSGGGGCSL